MEDNNLISNEENANIEVDEQSKEGGNAFKYQIRRNFNGTDAELIESGGVFQKQLSDNLADFATFDNSFNSEYCNNLANQVDYCMSFDTDSTITVIQTQHTKAWQDINKQCVTKYGEMKYFVTKAFAKEMHKVYLYEFGSSSLVAARTNAPLMVLFMTNLHNKAQKYKTELAAKGCTQAKIDEILTLRNNLLSALADQVGFIKSRPITTYQRIASLNILSQTLSNISAAAAIIYENNPAKRGMYVVND